MGAFQRYRFYCCRVTIGRVVFLLWIKRGIMTSHFEQSIWVELEVAIITFCSVCDSLITPIMTPLCSPWQGEHTDTTLVVVALLWREVAWTCVVLMIGCDTPFHAKCCLLQKKHVHIASISVEWLGSSHDDCVTKIPIIWPVWLRFITNFLKADGDGEIELW